MDPYLFLALLPIIGLVIFLVGFWLNDFKKKKVMLGKEHPLVEEIETWLRSRGKDSTDQ